VNLTEWARAQGVHPQTAYRWFREGTLPVPAVRVNERTVLVSPDAEEEVYTDPRVVARTQEALSRRGAAPPIAQPAREALLSALTAR
jgi:predicted site-specific integrase-resolvase